MKLLKAIIFFCFILVLINVGCTKPGSDPVPPDNETDSTQSKEDTAFAGLLKVDSISTWSTYVIPWICSPFNSIRFTQQYRFQYDSTGRISQLAAYSNMHPLEPYVYTFRYDKKKRIENIYYKSVRDGKHRDSLAFDYISEKVTEVYNIIAKDGIFFTLFTSRFYVASDSMNITVTATEYPATKKTVLLRAHLLLDDSSNIKRITYFRSEPFTTTDTALTITNTYYQDLHNPYYSIYKRLNFPLFFLLGYSDLTGTDFIMPTDLSQALSKHCIATTVKKTYGNVLCGEAPGIVTQNYEYPRFIFTTSTKNELTELPDTSPDFFNRTYSGFINAGAKYTYYK